MKKTRTVAFANLIGALFFIILGIWAWVKTCSFEVVKNSYVQPSAFPRIMIVGMLIFAVILFIQSLLKLLSMKEGDTDYLAADAPSLNFFKDRSLQAALLVIVMCVLYVALFKTLGYVICSAILAFVIMLLIGKRNWLQMILVAVLVPLVMWLIFYKVLTVNIPMGPLSFLADLVAKI